MTKEMFRDDSFVTGGGGGGGGGVGGFGLCRNKIYLISPPPPEYSNDPLSLENHVIASKSSTPYPLR